MQGFFLATILVFCVATSNLVIADGRRNFNAAEFGAIGDGQTDNSEAFLKAWEAVCTATVRGTATLEIPAGTFLLNPVKFEGPCKSNKVHLQVLGKIVAPRTIDEWRPRCKSSVWLLFRGISGLIVNGPGAIDGRGSNWWKLGQTHGCKRPRALQFHNCNHVKLSGLTHMNSPKVHIGVNGCKGVSISNLNISAPEDSPNTDGIGISGSTDVHISNSTIGTGDDCIAVNGGCSHINITNVTCGPGHGISVGSLGDKGCNDKVEDVHVQNCTFIGTQNGVRIKTWPAVAVELSGIKYSGVEGTSASKQAITFDCAKIGCRNIAMDQINITSSSPGKQIHAFCNNAKGTSTSTTPLVPCLLSL
ncbi:probable polygalacturonase At3g15720 isoform X4 [Ricinus communis]|uniref:probable polygalacturonase At3g15720 isoform X4 n=1 Tax=Ricinus communis TaxID=3988 RepID=UPI00201B11B7|nr:probable polygalacturonase At3g15720 isoform X4 [Ricinus communis]